MLPQRQRPKIPHFSTPLVWRNRGELLQSTASPWRRASITKLNTGCAGGNVFKRKKKKKSLGNSLALQTPDSEQWGSLVEWDHIWGLLCPWKKHLISLDFLRHLSAKEASGETHLHVKNAQMHRFKSEKYILKNCNYYSMRRITHFVQINSTST